MLRKEAASIIIVLVGLMISVIWTLLTTPVPFGFPLVQLAPVIILMVVSITLWKTPREKLPWRFGIIRWLLGDRTCAFCGRREGWFRRWDLGHPENVFMKPIRTVGTLKIGVKEFSELNRQSCDIRFGMIRCCGSPKCHQHQNNFDHIVIDQGGKKIIVRLESNVPSIQPIVVSTSAALGIIARLTGLHRGIVSSYVDPSMSDIFHGAHD